MFQGSLVALVTPMQKDGAVDEASLQALVEWHIAQGSDGIVAVGTTGESATLDEAEHCQLIAQVVEYADGRIPVIAGTGANATTEAIRLTYYAKEAGADACLLVTPYYNKPTQEGLYEHHVTVAEAVDIPQILYNVPARTACDMLPETVEQLAKIDNIIGIKEATGEVDRVGKIRQMCGVDFMIYSGDDASACESLLAGANGVISVTANVAPAQIQQMCRAILVGDNVSASEIDSTLSDLHRDLFCQSNPIPVKWALAEMGLIPEGIRLPLTWLSEQYHERLHNSLVQAEVIEH